MSNLGELGLSSYEEKAYRALLALGSATASELSAASGVPSGRIYDVLNGLEAREIVRSSGTEPTTYAAVDPETAVDRLLAERKRQLDARAERYEAVAAEAGSELASRPPAESRFWAAPLGSDEAVTLVGEAFADATDSVRSALGPPYASAPWERYEPEVEPYFDAVDAARARCLLDAALVERAPAEARAYADGATDCEFRVTTDLGMAFDLVDGRRVCLSVPHPVEEGRRLGVVDLHDEDLAARLEECFDAAWDAAVPLGDVAQPGEGTRAPVDPAGDRE